MPFHYESSVDPRQSATIADLMLRRGDIAAHAAQQNGAIWGGAIQNIGQMVGALPGQIALAKRAQLQDQIGAQQLADMKANAAERETQHTEQDFARHQALTSQIGLALHDRLRPDDPTNNLQAMQEALDAAERNKLITSEQAQQFGAMASADPSKIPEVAKSWAGLTPAGRAEIEKTITNKPGEVTTSRWDNTQVGTPQPEKKPDYTINGQRFSGDGTPLGEVVPPQHETAPKSYQHVDKLLDGKPATLLLDPAPGGKLYDLSGKEIDNASSRVKPIPPASVQINNQLAAGASQQASAAEKAIGDYKVPAPSARTMATPAGKAMMDRILAYNPDYDASQFPTRAKMRIQFSSGPQSQTINSINTAIGHLDQFVDVAKALGNGSFQPGNEAYNWLKKTFGDSAPTNFEGIRSIMAGELASAFKKSGATDQEIASVEKAISSKASTTQLVDYATKIAIPALGSKIAAFDQQYKQVMGKNDPFKVLTPDAEEVLTKYGFDPAHPRMGGSTNAAAPTLTPGLAGLAGRK
jgi:hypothetical protein